MSPKKILREFTPPIIWKVASRVASFGSARAELAAGTELPSEHYDAVFAASAEYQKHYSDSMYYFLWCVLIDRIRPEQVHCLLDVGCGPGQFAAFLHDRGLKRYVGLDFSAECIRLARISCPSFDFRCENAFESTLFNSLEYTVVVATEFLEHVQHDLMILSRIRSGTRVYASVPSFPYPGHVRHFGSRDEVTDRYRRYFRSFRVDEFACGSKGHRFFLFEGVRVDEEERADGGGPVVNRLF